MVLLVYPVGEYVAASFTFTPPCSLGRGASRFVVGPDVAKTAVSGEVSLDDHSKPR